MVKASSKPSVLPITIWQQYLIDEATHPDCPDDLRDRFTLANAFLVQPRIDMRRLRRAVDKLRQRHDSLRIRLRQVKGVWRALIDPPGEDIVRQIDLGEMNAADFHSTISAIANTPMPLIDAPLAEVIVASCAGRGDVLITRVHHAVTDGHGMVVLTEDLTKLLIGIPILGQAVSHADYIARFQSPPPHRAAEIAAYWKELHRDFPLAPNVGRKAKGLEPLKFGMGKVESRELNCRATPESLRRFEAVGAAANINPDTALFAGFLEGLCQCYDLEKMMFTVTIARSDPALDTYVGDHSLDPYLPYAAGGDHGFSAAIKTLAQTLMQARAYLPHDAARRGTAYHRALAQMGCYPNQFSVYQPDAMSRQRRSIFSEGFFNKHGDVQRIGPYALTSLDVSVPSRSYSDIRLVLGSSISRTGFSIRYDGISYTETEVRLLANKICQLLDLEPTAVALK